MQESDTIGCEVDTFLGELRHYIECYQVLVRYMKDDIMFLDEEKIRVKAMTCIGTEQW